MQAANAGDKAPHAIEQYVIHTAIIVTVVVLFYIFLVGK
jgi:hypothetical protein